MEATLRGYQTYANVTLIATYRTAFPGNDFTADPNAVAWWRFEQDDLTGDTLGFNDLTSFAITANTTYYKEGAASAYFRPVVTSADQTSLSIVDANLSDEFPGKNGTTNKKFSACFWTYISTLPTGTNYWGLLSKTNWYDGVSPYGYAVTCRAGGQIALNIGDKQLLHGSNVAAGRWYHITVTFDNATHTGTIQIWDATAGAALGTKATKTDFSPMAVSNAGFYVGGMDVLWYRAMRGFMDEVVVFNDILTDAEIAKIRAGTYGKP
jgi:hypothetical protein